MTYKGTLPGVIARIKVSKGIEEVDSWGLWIMKELEMMKRVDPMKGVEQVKSVDPMKPVERMEKDFEMSYVPITRNNLAAVAMAINTINMLAQKQEYKWLAMGATKRPVSGANMELRWPGVNKKFPAIFVRKLDESGIFRADKDIIQVKYDAIKGKIK